MRVSSPWSGMGQMSAAADVRVTYRSMPSSTSTSAGMVASSSKKLPVVATSEVSRLRWLDRVVA